VTPPPFFTVPGGNSARPRILLVSWHFPPGQSAGALRWEQLARHAARRGWELDVLTVDPAELGRRDDSRLERLPAGTRVFGVPAPEPVAARLEAVLHVAWRGLRGTRGTRVGRSGSDASGATDAPDQAPDTERPASLGRSETRLRPWSPGDWRRAFFAWVETRRQAAWAAEAVRIGRELLSAETGVRLVLSCGPPHEAHEAGRRLATDGGLSFVMDLRDPWSQVQRLPEHVASPIWYGIASRHERRCVRAADLVVANTEPARDALAAEYPDAEQRIISVMNGFDEEPLRDASVREVAAGGRFVLAHAGTVYLDRDPRPLFRALARLSRTRDVGPDRLGMTFFGCTDEGVRRIAEDEGVGAYVELVPFLSRYELARRLFACPVLVVLPQDSDMAIPSKVFEYLRYPAWVLAMAEPDSATGRVLRDTPAAVVSASNVHRLAARLADWFERFESGERPGPAARSAPQLSRRAQADRLFDRLEVYRAAESSSS